MIVHIADKTIDILVNDLPSNCTDIPFYCDSGQLSRLSIGSGIATTALIDNIHIDQP
jgi:hypothetical protein